MSARRLAGLFQNVCFPCAEWVSNGFDVSVAMTLVCFGPVSHDFFFWLRRAWRILVKRDFSEVALKQVSRR